MGKENDTGVLVLCAGLAALPLRLTTSEVCALGRWSIRTFMRRRKTGQFLVEPIDRGSELLFPRDPVLRALGLITDDTAPKAQLEKPRVSVDAIRARQNAARRGTTAGRGALAAKRPK